MRKPVSAFTVRATAFAPAANVAHRSGDNPSASVMRPACFSRTGSAPNVRPESVPTLGTWTATPADAIAARSPSVKRATRASSTS